MRNFPLLIIALTTLASPAGAADKLGKRTAPPEQAMSGIGEGSSDAALAQAIAAAAAFPLGTLQNPVRVGGPEGERAYVAKLRCADGKRPQIGPTRPGGVGAYGSVADVVPLDCAAAAPGRVDLVVDPYFEEQPETRPPAGFTFGPR
jgi:hypothetical protein